MKGKKKLLTMLLATIALVITGVVFGLGDTIKNIAYAQASELPGYSLEFEGKDKGSNIIFSVERVYFAKNEADRNKKLTYGGGYNFNPIATNEGVRYFGDYGLYNDTTGSYANKSVVKDGKFTKLDDTININAADTDGKDVALQQGVMVTFGGYYHTSESDSSNVATNVIEWKDDNSDNIIQITELTGWTEVTLDRLPGWTDTNNDDLVDIGELTGWMDSDEDGTVDVYTNTGAEMQYVSVQVKRDGTVLTDIPSSRTYNNQYQDFTWFIDGTKGNEGHYEISISYMIDGKALKAEFDFYLLLESSYSNTVEVNGNEYTPKPTFTNITPKGTSTATNRQYFFYYGDNYNYPTLTYDYTRYKVSYKHISGDLHKTVDVAYDDAGRQIVVTTTIYDIPTSKYYSIDDFTNPNDNHIISLMFADNGQYIFDVNYIYTKDDTNLVIDKTDLTFGNMSLDIYGYQLKYSKAGFVSADMVDLKIVQNGTMFILLNGFTNAAKERDGDALGIHYELVAGTEKTGTVKQGESGSTNKFTDGATLPSKYSKTDRGLWLTLNDEYDLYDGPTDTTYSEYWYSTSPISSVSSGGIKLTKVTTFTAPGYYLVKACYKYQLDKGSEDRTLATQYFAFQITSATPQLALYKTEGEDVDGDKTNFYAREYTNQNVFATWEDRGVFESQITGKLYYTTNKAYHTEETYLSVINGGASSSNIKYRSYVKNTLITDSDAYMLVLEVERSATRTYSYFTIDKEAISGFEVYQVSTQTLDNKAIYTISRNAQLQYITHTSKGAINTDFTIGWNDKASGAKISATYVYTPFIKTDAEIDTPSVTTGNTTYIYVTNTYIAGSTSKAISIDRPLTLSGALSGDNVLTDQGIYEFTLTDQAGNILKYIMIIDHTDAIVTAKYGENKESASPYSSGEKVADPVYSEWGTHKAIDLNSVTTTSNTTIYNLLHKDNSAITDYYNDYYQVAGNNWNNVLSLFTVVSGKQLYAVQHEYVEFKEVADNNYYRITKYGEKQTRYSGGISSGWTTGGVADRLFTDYTNAELKILVDEEGTRRYTVSVVGGNQVDNNTNINFNIVITPDKSLGTIYSTSATNDAGEFETLVNTVERPSNSKAIGTQITVENADGTSTQLILDDSLTIGDCSSAQASDDGKFVFEWIKPDTEDNFEVISVVYHYYKLMSSSELNAVNDKSTELYYPYSYVKTSEILTKDGDTITVKDYTEGTRDDNDIYRSNPINLGYETYYEGESLVSRSVTQTGLYIITRTLITGNDLSKAENFSYAFFVDRNSIVGYSLSNVSEKIVGQFIHTSMPTSDGEVHYDNFTKQGLKSKQLTYGDDSFNYKVYVETNKMPTSIKVPSGKYVTGTYSDASSNIVATSYNTLKLQLSIYFIDTYKILPQSVINDGETTIKLMNRKEYTADAYIYLDFATDDTGMQGLLAEYKNARIHSNDNLLSLPGTYVFVINDLVGTERGDDFSVTDYNTFVFGIKLTKQEPTIDVYAYAQNTEKNIIGSNTYATGKVLYTNQEYVKFEIDLEDTTSYNAQVDQKNFSIYRSNLDGSDNKLWFEIKNGIVNSSLPQNDDLIIDKTDENKWIIKLPTDIVTNEYGQIISYGQYVYTINVQYILSNTASQYYTYKYASKKETGEEVNLVNTDFYKSVYAVYIDRTPDSTNLNNILSSQESYFENYHQWLAGETDMNASENINTTFVYRNTNSIGDYYGLTNNLYYQFINNAEYNNASQAMYAITVDDTTLFNKDGLYAVYYRELNFDNTLDAKQRMGLLPICDTYFGNSTGFYTFNESLTEYKMNKFSSFNGKYMSVIVGSDSYESIDGKYYEIVEKDEAGNLTQYVIYFKPTTTINISLTTNGQLIGEDEAEDIGMNFAEMITDDNQRAFMKINGITLNNLATAGSEFSYYAYYGNINIYNASGNKVKAVYLNSKSKPEDVSAEILEVVQGQGNYRVEFVDVYGNKYLLAINTYTSGNYKLNTSAFTYKVGDFGQKYLLLSEVNNQIDENTWWYVKNVTIKYKSTNGNEHTLLYTASFNAGSTTLSAENDYSSIDEVKLRTDIASDRLDLADNIQYLITLTDIANNSYPLTISTTEGYYAYKYVDLPNNIYQHNDVLYAATDITISYNIDFYEAGVKLDSGEATENTHYTKTTIGKYAYITLLADKPQNPEDLGSCRDFDLEIRLLGEKNVTHTYNVVIDTTSTLFKIENTNYEDKISMIKSTFNNEGQDYNIIDLRDGKYYKDLIAETVNISWTKATSDYFIYTYDLYEFTNQNEYRSLLDGGEDSYLIAPKESNTGKYILKVTIKAKDGEWIASRVYGIAMSTTISGLYEVRDANDNICEFATLTNLEEVITTFGGISNLLSKWAILGFDNENHMNTAITSFGTQTAVKMYIAKNKIIDIGDSNYVPALILHSNQDNGVYANSCELMTGTALIRLYHVSRSNYRTFVVTMEVRETDTSTSILSELLFITGDEQADQNNLLSSGTSKVIYDADAKYYKLKFSSYNKNHNNTNPLEQRNLTIIDIYYNNDESTSRRIIGNASESLSEINFKNSGSYTLKIQDYAGNVQYFKTSTSISDSFTIVLMKKNDILYTVNDQAPIQYAFYDKDVVLQINRYNEATGVNNYDLNSISINVNLNGTPNYKGYEHPSESTKYIFKDYGTYVVEITAKLLSTGEEVSTRLIFTILNPNEARSALDFTSIYGYEIVSVFSVTKTAERDVTSKFVGMLQDKANAGGVDVYNKLVTYERLIETFGTATQGKMKFKMLYRVNDDPLLPTREVEFSFTLNNEKPTITTSIKAGEETTKPVVLKFNAENVYDQVGDCNLVVNGQVIMRIDETTKGITQIELSAVNEYYVQLVGDSGNVLTSFNFTIKEPLNTVAIILIVIVVLIVVGLIGTVIWLRTRMKVR